MTSKNTITLLILDGFGYSEDPAHNAVLNAKTPHLDSIKSRYPHGLINASENFVGLPEGQMGNSEVGHINIGAGRVVFQDIQRINNAIEDETIKQNQRLVDAFNELKKSKGKLHLLGLLSDGGVHSHYDHFESFLNLAKENQIPETFVHAFLDGRDTPPKSADKFISHLESYFNSISYGKFGSVSGRFYAMDRDNRWDRIQPVYEMLTEGKTKYKSESAIAALNEGYLRDELDEFISPTIIDEKSIIKNNDLVIFLNFRSDRGRELTKALTQENFDEFQRSIIPNGLTYLTMTSYDQSLKNVQVIFPPIKLENTFGDYISQMGLTQLRIAETEKYPHVTFFFNGGEEQEFKNEDRILIPSPDVRTYDLKPEMSVFEVTEKLTEAILSSRYDVIVCNFANGDMVGHTGNFEAAVKAVEAMDMCIGKILSATNNVDGSLIITADHGNAELMMDIKNNQLHTQHTTNQVPLIVVNEKAGSIKPNGKLSDLAPTILGLLNLRVPDEMTGQNLIKLNDE